MIYGFVSYNKFQSNKDSNNNIYRVYFSTHLEISFHSYFNNSNSNILLLPYVWVKDAIFIIIYYYYDYNYYFNNKRTKINKK